MSTALTYLVDEQIHWVTGVDRLGGGVDRIGEGVDRLNEGVDRQGNVLRRLGEKADTVCTGVDRQGEVLCRLDQEVGRLGAELVEVKTCLERMTSELGRLIEERREFAQATQDALAHHHFALSAEEIEKIIRKARRISGSRASLGSGAGPRSLEAVTHITAEDSFPDEVFGGDDILDHMIAEILNGDYRKCIGLWNMGGAGKTFTAGRVYRDPRIQSYFDGTRHRLWVTVSKRNTYSVFKEIFMKLGGCEDDFPAADDVYGMRRALKGHLNLEKFLLIIDDVWEISQLDFMDLISEPEDSKRRVVLVTTRDQKILERKYATKIEVSLLSEDDSWKLFSRNVFGRAQVPGDLEDVSRFVAAECKGLPLALKVIGSTLAGETNQQAWENSLKKLKHASVLSKEHEEQVFGRLQLSVDNLRDRDNVDSRLQHCFYYFAAYPEDADIAVQDLVNLLTAEGIVGKDPGSPISPNDEAYEVLGILIALSMIELRNSSNFLPPIHICKIHDVMRDLARYNLETTFGQKLSITEKIPACKRVCLYKPGLQLPTFPQDWTSSYGADGTTSTKFSMQRLSLTDNELQQLPEHLNAPDLRVVLLGRNPSLASLPDQFFQSFRSLRVLDLQETLIEKIPETVFDLISLVFLNLSHCTLLRQISASIERLQNLQQLGIDYCGSLTSVPSGFRRLKSLKILHSYGTEIWREHDSSRGDVSTLQDLVLLKSLQSLSMNARWLRHVPQICELTALQILALECPNMKILPESFTKLTNLKTLKLYCRRLASLPALDHLQQLEKLRLSTDVLERLPDSFVQCGAFPSLKSFGMECEQLECPNLEQGAMPQLKVFIIEFSAVNLKNLSASFQVLGNLIYLELSDCFSLENLLAFDKPNSFLYLKEIKLRGSESVQNLPAGLLKSAPNLRKLDLVDTGVSRSDIPEDLLEKEKLKQLEILI